MGRVVVFGSANVDLVLAVDRLPHPGETVQAASVHRQPGGKGLNQAIAAHRFGASTMLVTCVGDDADGELLRTAMTTFGLDTTGLEVAAGPTGTAVIMVDADGENLIAVSAGANAEVGPRPLSLAAGDVLLSVLEVPVEAVATMSRDRPPACRSIMNLAPAPPAEAIDLLRGVADLVVANQHEAASIVGPGHGSIEGLASALSAALDCAAIVTAGGAGGAVCDGRGPRTFAAHPTTVVDTVGAGDAFCGVLAAALSEVDDLDRAIGLAAAAGALAVAQPGAADAMPTGDAIRDALAAPSTPSRVSQLAPAPAAPHSTAP